MDVTQTRSGMTLEDFLAESQRHRFELINGEVVELMPNSFEHSQLMMLIYDAIRDFLRQYPLGKAYVETTFIVPDRTDANWLKGSRIPDILFISNAKLETFIRSPLHQSGRPLAALPDLVIEIVSPTDNYSDVTNKAMLYLQDGVSLVWIFDYEYQRVQLFTAGSTSHYVSGDETLTGGDVLPGFALQLSALFSA